MKDALVSSRIATIVIAAAFILAMWLQPEGWWRIFLTSWMAVVIAAQAYRLGKERHWS